MSPACLKKKEEVYICKFRYTWTRARAGAGTDSPKTQLTALKQSLKDHGFEHFTPNRSAAVEKSDDDFQPLNEMLQVIKSSKNQNLTRVLAQIQSAISKFDEDIDMVGRCEECDECIPMGRLQIFPYAQFCVRCQSELEESRSSSGARKHLTDYR